MNMAISRYVIAAAVAVVITFLLIWTMPLSLQFSITPKEEIETRSIMLADLRRPEPPPPKREEVKKKTPTPKVHPKLKDIMPKMDTAKLSMLDIPFDFNLELSQGEGELTKGVEMSMGTKIWNELDVDMKPVPLFRAKPTYPKEAKNKSLTGRVEFRLLVDRDGKVKQVEILTADPQGVFEQATQEAVTRWRFQPAKVKGVAVACWVKTAIDYELE